MAHAYTPGLKVTEKAIVRKTRRLPLLGEVLVEKGDAVDPHTIVATTNIPGNPQTVNIANALGIEPEDIPDFMLKKEGDTVEKDEVMARYNAFFGFVKKEVKSPVDGVIEMVSTVTGQVTLREPPVPIQVDAYLTGVVDEVLPKEGVVVKTEGAFIQGIFGVGGETQGPIKVNVDDGDQVLDETRFYPEDEGKIVVGGSLVTIGGLNKAAEVGVRAVVAGGIIDADLVEFLGHDIGVAITGHENVPFTLVLTEGFGAMRMAGRTFSLLKQLEGLHASINGATQIRAGVMRPEIIVPGYNPQKECGDNDLSSGLLPGTPIRIIREPYFGAIAEVLELPPELSEIESGAKVRILKAKLQDGSIVTVPRANVEMIEA